MKYSAGAYHLHMTGRLWWCRPLAQESRSTSQFATAPRFCSCCSSDATPPPRRCLFGHDALLEKQQERWNNQQGFSPAVVQYLRLHTVGLGLSPIRISLLGLYCLFCIRLISLNNERITRASRLPIFLKGAFYYRGFNFPVFMCFILLKVFFFFE